MYCHALNKTARGDAIINLKYFWASEHQRHNFDGFIYIHYAVPPYSAGAIIIASVYGKWVKTTTLSFRHLAFRRVENRPKISFSSPNF